MGKSCHTQAMSGPVKLWVPLGSPPRALRLPAAPPAPGEPVPGWVRRAAGSGQAYLWSDEKRGLAGLIQGERIVSWDSRAGTQGVLAARPCGVILGVRAPGGGRTLRLVAWGTRRFEGRSWRWLRERAGLLGAAFSAGLSVEDWSDEG